MNTMIKNSNSLHCIILLNDLLYLLYFESDNLMSIINNEYDDKNNDTLHCYPCKPSTIYKDNGL